MYTTSHALQFSKQVRRDVPFLMVKSFASFYFENKETLSALVNINMVKFSRVEKFSYSSSFFKNSIEFLLEKNNAN